MQRTTVILAECRAGGWRAGGPIMGAPFMTRTLRHERDDAAEHPRVAHISNHHKSGGGWPTSQITINRGAPHLDSEMWVRRMLNGPSHYPSYTSPRCRIRVTLTSSFASSTV